MTRHAGWVLGMALLLLTGSTSAWSQGAARTEQVHVKKSTLVETVPGGEIDWGNQMFYATGEGIMPSKSEESNRARAYLKAKDYARMQAIANLLMVVEGTAISYEGYGRDYMARDVVLRQKIEGFVRGVEIFGDERITMDGHEMVRVTVGTKMYGKRTPGTALLEHTTTLPVEDKPEPLPVKVDIPKEPSKPVVKPGETAAPRPEQQKGPFTSLIVDTRGFNVATAISPKLRKSDGSEVWGTLPVSAEFAIETGIVSYTDSMEMARKSGRCGGNPLIVRAVGRAGGRAMCDAVISDADAALILAENAKTKFLDQCKVIWIVDPKTRAQTGR